MDIGVGNVDIHRVSKTQEEPENMWPQVHQYAIYIAHGDNMLEDDEDALFDDLVRNKLPKAQAEGWLTMSL